MDLISSKILEQMARINDPRTATSQQTINQPEEPFDLSMLPMLLYFLLKGGDGTTPGATPDLAASAFGGAGTGAAGTAGLGTTGTMSPTMAGLNVPMPTGDQAAQGGLDPMSIMKLLGFRG